MNWQRGINIQINLVLLVFSVILVLSTLKYPFYWDNVVQISVPANWYYQTDFRYFFLPDSIATGHPTFIGMYFALLWKLFGRSLIVCHWGMLPFVFGLLFQLQKFLRNIGISNGFKVLIILGFIIFDTTFLSQLSLITFDIIQLFFFFLCINLILTGRNIAFGFYYLILTLISLRASIMAGGIFLFNILYDYYLMNKKFKPVEYLKYIPGILSLAIFLISFKLDKGWVIHNSVSKAWQESGEFATAGQVLRNTGVFIWRIIDFGRIGVFAFFLIFIIKVISIRKFQDNESKILFLIILTQFVLFFPILIFSQNAFGHRYLLSIIVPAIILTVNWILSFKKLSSLWLTFTFILLVSGHFWLYPLKISQGWDATTLHWNYFEVSEKMNSYIRENKISKKEIGTFFPNRRSRYLTHLEKDENDLYSGIPFVNEYILFSNTFNVNDDVIDTLYSENSKWKLIKKYSKNNIFISLYHKESTISR